MKSTNRLLIMNALLITVAAVVVSFFVISGIRQEIATEIAIVMAAVLFLGSLFLSKKIISPLAEKSDVAAPVPTPEKELIGPLVEKFSDISEQIHSHTKAIAKTIAQQSGLATRLSSSVVEISSTMEEFSSTAVQIAQHSQGVVERADKTLEDTRIGATEVENLTFKVSDISHNIESNLREIVDLGKKSKEINKIMEIINNIANQTKLIAFNAALEAASAGESGRRFGVVAVEIRRLADSVVESTSEIEGKITEIQDAVTRLIMSSEKSSDMIREGQEYASHTVSMLIESVDGVEETANAARQISLSTQQQQIASSQVVLALKDIKEGARDSNDSVQQSSRATDELAALTDQLRALVASLDITAATPREMS